MQDLSKRGWAFVLCLCLAGLASAQEEDSKAEKKKPDFPPFDEVAKDYEKVVSTVDEEPSLYTLWIRKKDGQMLAELPRGYERQRHYIALTTPTGETFAGLQSSERYVYWRRYDKRVALIELNIDTRSTGDVESRDSIRRHITDQVLVDVPIACMGENGQPVIDMDDLFVENASTFYEQAGGLKKNLATIAKAKAFPENIEVAFEVPDRSGEVKTFYYSLSRIPDGTDYEPREADDRVGFFTTVYRDLGKFKRDDVWVRYVNRWKLEKADPKLKLSPPKEPIVYYIEHTVPVRYRRYVKQGVLAWNAAFEKVGISDAIVVQYQDKSTGANMDKDPEDVRYNFVRWLSNDVGTAIGPSRAHPVTGQILDADVVLTDGWIRAFWYQANEFLPDVAMEGFSQETLAWLDEHPDWDPRVRLAPPAERQRILDQRARRRALGPVAWDVLAGDGALITQDDLRELATDAGFGSELCLASHGKAQSMSLMGLTFEVLGLLEDEVGDRDGARGEDRDERGEKKEEADTIDGIPEWFLGPALAELVSHEIGHTLGLRHNFKSSSIYTLAQMNSPEFKGRALAGSVMDYLPVNVNMGEGEVQGDFSMHGVGPYDMWAIEYGYTFDDPKKVLERVSEPELAYLTDEDTMGPDPLARRYDLSAEPLDYAKNRLRIALVSRERILDRFVKEGQSWAKARRGYEITLRTQMDAVSIMANWLGGAFVCRDHKGDPGGRLPITVVPAEKQRVALDFVIENCFRDESYGLSPELLTRMTVDKWADEGGRRDYMSDPTWPIHDRIAGMQVTTLTMLMNPTTLRRVYDNEFFVAADEDALTLPELMQKVTASVWTEIGYPMDEVASTNASATAQPASYSARQPMISSLRRNLQREHLERLIDLCLSKVDSASEKQVSLLARTTLQDLGKAVEEAVASASDPYTRAHLADTQLRIAKAMDASYSYATRDDAAGSGIVIRFGQPEGEDD